ncbi:glycosyltransferase, partial [Calditrichota bacterium]
EENRIIPCLQSLEKLDYPKEKYEIIFVDDLSSDKTAEIVAEYCNKNSNWNLIKIIESNNILHGKKNALLHGISKAKGDIIFTTDADCIVPTGWLTNMVPYFQPGVSMVLGYSPLKKGNSFFRKILEFDNLFSAISASAPTKLGYPFTSVGRNLAYRKDAYENAGGFLALKKFRSGDDVHMTERFRYLNTGIIEYSIHPDSFVETIPPDTGTEIFHQQVRKNSKTLKKSPTSIIFSIILFLYYLIFALIPFISEKWINIWLVLLAVKFIIEFVCLKKAAVLFRQQHIIKYLPIMQIIYPAYIMFFSLLGVFQLYQWKK